MNTTEERLDYIIRDRVETLLTRALSVKDTDPELHDWLSDYVLAFCMDMDFSPEPIVWLKSLL